MSAPVAFHLQSARTFLAIGSVLFGAILLLSSGTANAWPERNQRPVASQSGPTYNCEVADSCQIYGDGLDHPGVVINCQVDNACVTDARWTGRDISRALLAAALLVLAVALWSTRFIRGRPQRTGQDRPVLDA